MDKGLTCPVTAVSLGAALARHTVGTQCVGLSLSSLHHTAELTEASSFTKVTCALQVKSSQSGCVRFCGVSAWPHCQSPEFPSSQSDREPPQTYPMPLLAKRTSDRTMGLSKKNPFCTAPNPAPSSPLYFSARSISLLTLAI